MSTTGISCHRGTSTILGTLIFVGIIFSAVIPMMLVVKQADTLHEMRKHELGILDQERGDEALYVYVQTVDTAEDPRTLIIKVQNKGALSVNIVRLWINDESIPIEYNIQPMSGIEEIFSYPVPEEDGSYYIVVTTNRGNSVAFDTYLNWDFDLGWDSDVKLVNVLINSLPGNIFKIEVTGPSYDEEALTLKYEPKFFDVVNEGQYTVKIYRGTKEIYSEQATITLSEPVYWVFA